jgi:hypothetical protein
MAKTLKIWNGRGHGDYDRGHFYVAAFTKKQACELLGKAAGWTSSPIPMSELNNYYAQGAWGNTMDGIPPTEPCVYATKDFHDDNPIKIL